MQHPQLSPPGHRTGYWVVSEAGKADGRYPPRSTDEMYLFLYFQCYGALLLAWDLLLIISSLSAFFSVEIPVAVWLASDMFATSPDCEGLCCGHQCLVYGPSLGRHFFIKTDSEESCCWPWQSNRIQIYPLIVNNWKREQRNVLMASDIAQQARQDCNLSDKGNKWGESSDHPSFWLEAEFGLPNRKGMSSRARRSCWFERQK